MQTKNKKQRPSSHCQIRTPENAKLKESNSSLRYSKFIDNQQDFNKTSMTLSKINFQHHNSQTCLCKQCNCGRHLCQFQCVRPDVMKTTEYKKSFKKTSSSFFSAPKKIQFIQKQLNPPIIQMETTYSKMFPKNNQQKEKMLKKQDNLKFDGPGSNLTSYTTQYPGYNGKNPYFRVNPEPSRGGAKFRSTSSYGRQFFNRNSSRVQSFKKQDNLSCSKEWFGKSSYKEAYKSPNPQSYMPHQGLHVQKYEKLNNSSTHFDTTYGKNFIGYESPMCPAKVLMKTLLLSKLSDTMKSSKMQFRENTDFKDLDKQFHPLSSSKC